MGSAPSRASYLLRKPSPPGLSLGEAVPTIPQEGHGALGLSVVLPGVLVHTPSTPPTSSHALGYGASAAFVVKECQAGRVPWTLLLVPPHLHQYLIAIITTSTSMQAPPSPPPPVSVQHIQHTYCVPDARLSLELLREVRPSLPLRDLFSG